MVCELSYRISTYFLSLRNRRNVESLKWIRKLSGLYKCSCTMSTELMPVNHISNSINHIIAESEIVITFVQVYDLKK